MRFWGPHNVVRRIPAACLECSLQNVSGGLREGFLGPLKHVYEGEGRMVVKASGNTRIENLRGKGSECLDRISKVRHIRFLIYPRRIFRVAWVGF